MAREDSDYDIAVFFRRDEVSILDEVSLALDIAEALGVLLDRIDVVALNKADSILIARVFKEGRVFYSDDEELRRKWERKTYLKILRENDLTYTYLDRVLKKNKNDEVQTSKPLAHSISAFSTVVTLF